MSIPHRNSKLFHRVLGLNLGVGLLCSIISAPALADSSTQLHTCHNAVAALVGLPKSMMDVSVLKDNEQVVYPNSARVTVKRPSVTSTLRSILGTCEFDNLGKLVKIDTLFYSEKTPALRDFGDFSNQGHLIVLLTSTGVNGIGKPFILSISDDSKGNSDGSIELFFPVLLGSQKEWWWADCETKKVGRLTDKGEKATISISSKLLEEQINEYICSL